MAGKLRVALLKCMAGKLRVALQCARPDRRVGVRRLRFVACPEALKEEGLTQDAKYFCVQANPGDDHISLSQACVFRCAKRTCGGCFCFCLV